MGIVIATKINMEVSNNPLPLLLSSFLALQMDYQNSTAPGQDELFCYINLFRYKKIKFKTKLFLQTIYYSYVCVASYKSSWPTGFLFLIYSARSSQKRG